MKKGVSRMAQYVVIGNGNTAFMKSGKTVRFDVLVLAVGVRANTSLIKGIGGEVNRGILISNKMETSFLIFMPLATVRKAKTFRSTINVSLPFCQMLICKEIVLASIWQAVLLFSIKESL